MQIIVSETVSLDRVGRYAYSQDRAVQVCYRYQKHENIEEVNHE